MSSNDQRRIIFKEIKLKYFNKTKSTTKYAIWANWWYQWWDFVNVSVDEIAKKQNIALQQKHDAEPLSTFNNSQSSENLNKLKNADLNTDEFETLKLDTHGLPANAPKEFVVLEPLINWDLTVIEKDEFYDRPG